MTRAVVYSQRAQQQLSDLYMWVVELSGSPERAEAYVASVLMLCEQLGNYPLLGKARDDVRRGLRVIGFRRRLAIAFAVEKHTVQILGVYSGGQDYESTLWGEAHEGPV